MRMSCVVRGKVILHTLRSSVEGHNWCPKRQDCVLIPRTGNVILCGKKVFVNVIKRRISRWHCPVLVRDPRREDRQGGQVGGQKDPPPESLARARPCLLTADFELLASRTVTEYAFVIPSHQTVGNFPRESPEGFWRALGWMWNTLVLKRVYFPPRNYSELITADLSRISWQGYSWKPLLLLLF